MIAFLYVYICKSLHFVVTQPIKESLLNECYLSSVHIFVDLRIFLSSSYTCRFFTVFAFPIENECDSDASSHESLRRRTWKSPSLVCVVVCRNVGTYIHALELFRSRTSLILTRFQYLTHVIGLTFAIPLQALQSRRNFT